MTSADQVSIGVVIRTKDRPQFVRRALATVQSQTHQNWHVVLVNDGGDAARLGAVIAPERAALEGQRKLTMLDLTPGLGRSAAFNRGVAALDSELVACLDDDDTWDPDFMSALASFYIRTRAHIPELGGVAAQVTALREDLVDTGEVQDIRVIGEDTLPPSFHRGEFFLNPLAYACYRQDIYPVQWLIRREAIFAVGGFPEHFDVMEDRAFMNLFLARYRLAILDRKLAFHHRRVSRADDRTRNVLMNTLDNPSYDWRQFADLARPGIDLASDSVAAATTRSIAADLLAELNYETSAIWQKVDGEMNALRDRLDRDRSEVQAAFSALMLDLSAALQPADEQGAPAPAPAPAIPRVPEQQRVFDLWRKLPQEDHSQHVSPGLRFAEQLELSCHTPGNGFLMQNSPQQRQLYLQIPDTGDWAAIEICLDGLVQPGQGLRVHLQLATSACYLFETALVRQIQGAGGATEYPISDFAVHACRQSLGCVIMREIDADWLSEARSPKLSIILPRQARNFAFICNELVVESVPSV